MRFIPYFVAAGTLAIAAVLSIALGEVWIPPGEVASLLLERLFSFNFTADEANISERIIFQIRLPRTVLIALTGAALGTSGAAYQGIFRNPLADPYLLGIAPGAGLGAVIAMVAAWPPGLIPAAALLGALGTVAMVYALARVGRTTPVTTLVLSGVAVGAFAHACTSFFMIYRDLDLRRVFNFLLGGFSLGGWVPVAASAPYVVAGLAILLLLGRPLNALQFGDEQASQLGLDVERTKILAVVAASLAAAAAVAFSGIIGFVGLVVPHLIRLLWGSDYRRLLPLSLLSGAAVLLLADTAGRAVAPLRQLPVGIITALGGAPFFLYLLRRVRQSYW